MLTSQDIVLSFAECICRCFTKSECCKVSFHFYVFSYIMTICLCDVVMLLGFVCMITLLVLTIIIHLHMLVQLCITSYLSVFSFVYGFID